MNRSPALDAWRAELAAGKRTVHTFDPLWRAACEEISALEHDAAGLPAIAAGQFASDGDAMSAVREFARERVQVGLDSADLGELTGDNENSHYVTRVIRLHTRCALAVSVKDDSSTVALRSDADASCRSGHESVNDPAQRQSYG